jgi:hypothetical protein
VDCLKWNGNLCPLIVCRSVCSTCTLLVQVGGVIDIQVGVGAPPAGPVGWGLQSPRQENAVWSGGFARTSLRYKPEAKQKAKHQHRGVVEGSSPDPSFPSLARSLPNRRRRYRRRSRRQRLTGHTAEGTSSASHPNVFAPFAGEASTPSPPGPRALLAGTGLARGGGETCPGLEIVPSYVGEFPKLAPVTGASSLLRQR